MINIDYKNARALDIHRWSDYFEVNTFVNEIYSDLKSIKGNEAISKTKPSAKSSSKLFCWIFMWLGVPTIH